MSTSTKRPERAEFSARKGFAGNRLQRDSEARTEDCLAEALRHPDAGVFLSYGGRWLLRPEASSPIFDAPAALALAEPGSGAVLLGYAEGGAPRLAMRAAASAAADAASALDLRSIAAQRLVDGNVEGQMAQAAHLLNWHDSARFCGRCGGATVPEAAGYRLRCTQCGTAIFPRTDPVAIMLVHDGAGNCILGRQPHFPPDLWSCLAGFIEPGETLEDAVRREVLEEAGVGTGDVSYFASQPWPFPGSLMIGCVAEALDLTIRFDARELEDCRWFSREEVDAMLRGVHPQGLMAPQPIAIAHHLLRHFADRFNQETRGSAETATNFRRSGAAG